MSKYFVSHYQIWLPSFSCLLEGLFQIFKNFRTKLSRSKLPFLLSVSLFPGMEICCQSGTQLWVKHLVHPHASFCWVHPSFRPFFPLPTYHSLFFFSFHLAQPTLYPCFPLWGRLKGIFLVSLRLTTHTQSLLEFLTYFLNVLFICVYVSLFTKRPKNIRKWLGEYLLRGLTVSSSKAGFCLVKYLLALHPYSMQITKINKAGKNKQKLTEEWLNISVCCLSFTLSQTAARKNAGYFKALWQSANQ